MSGITPDAPEAPEPPKPPAKRPERRGTIQPEDIVVADSEQTTESQGKGKRALRRPAGAGSGGSSKSVGTGLSA